MNTAQFDATVPQTGHDSGIASRFHSAAASHAPADRRSTSRRRALPAAHAATGFLTGMLDAIDYGLAIVDHQSCVVMMNDLARAELRRKRFVHLDGDRLTARNKERATRIDTALGDCAYGVRCLLTFSAAAGDLTLSFVPLDFGGSDGAPMRGFAYSIVLFSKRETCPGFTLQQFGRQHHLSNAERALLPAISRGLSDAEIAEEHNVAVSTVRSHIQGIRIKTGVKSMRALMARLNCLPPILPVAARAYRAGRAAV